MADDNIPNKGDRDYVDYVIRVSQSGVLRQGVINEPRAYFDEIIVNPDPAVETEGNAGVFYNGEEFPVRLTHVLFATRYLNNAEPPVLADPLILQQIGVRFLFHQQYYMNQNFLPAPVWGNKVVAQSFQVDSSVSSWDFVANGQPFVLSARDTLQVTVQLNDAANPPAGVPVTVAFTGFGMLSKRPYFLQGRLVLTDLAPHIIVTTDYRNDGTEPIVITDMMVNVAAEDGAQDPRGNIDRVSLQVKQVGNGTQADWFRGPTNPLISRMQATLCGVTTGRAVAHQFPGDGVILEPGEGFTVVTQNLGLAQDFDDTVLVLSANGYVMVV